MDTLYTIGYGGTNPANLIACLKEAGVNVLVDVRAVAASRRPGFAKTALREAIESAGLSYVHLRMLGTPKAGRMAAREGDLGTFHAVYDAHLATPEAIDELARLGALAAERPCCLLCVEENPDHCHRTVIGQRLSGFRVIDLHPKGKD